MKNPFCFKNIYKMNRNLLSNCCLLIFVSNMCDSQVLQFGTCAEVETMRYFDLERFLGIWYEVYRFPTWYEEFSSCAYKRIQYCGRRIEIEHVFIRDGIQFILHVNSSYYPGDDAIFVIQESNIDPVGIPLTVISTDYDNYALVYGCRNKEDLGIKYLSAWVLSRSPSLLDVHHQSVISELSSVPGANAAFMEKVEHSEEKCRYHWTAHVQAVNNNTTEENK